MKPQITITISGAQASGKSTLAQYLGNHLRDLHGVNIVLKDDMNSGHLIPSYAELPHYFDADVTIVTEVK